MRGDGKRRSRDSRADSFPLISFDALDSRVTSSLVQIEPDGSGGSNFEVLFCCCCTVIQRRFSSLLISFGGEERNKRINRRVSSTSSLPLLSSLRQSRESHPHPPRKKRNHLLYRLAETAAQTQQSSDSQPRRYTRPDSSSCLLRLALNIDGLLLALVLLLVWVGLFA